MTSWILIALSGYLLLAFSSVADKFLVSKVVREPIAYAFYTAITGPLSLLLIPFGAKILTVNDFGVALLSGIFFVAGIYHSYSAIARSSVSRVIPIQGGLIPLFSLISAYFILGERLSGIQSLAFYFLVGGAVLISFKKEHGAWTTRALYHAAVSSLFFALSAVLTKYIFDHSNFISGMIWTRMGFFLAALPIIIFKKNRKVIFNAPKEAGAKNVALYYSSRASGTIGGFLQNYAVSLGSVVVVNGLQGMQFVFLLIMTTFVSIYYPKVLKEKITLGIIALKIAAIIVISIGLALLVVPSFKPAATINFGITYSNRYAQSLGLDSKQVYLDILNDLKPKKVRLMAYWEDIEPTRGEFSAGGGPASGWDYSTQDFMLSEAQKRGVEVVLVVGRKQPRWPECHQPDWYQGLSSNDQNAALINMLNAAIGHFKQFTAIKAWQVENEPDFSFGYNCGTIPQELLKQEVQTVKALDSRPIILTASGEQGNWNKVAGDGADIVGITMYRTVYNKWLGYYKYPLPALFYQIKATFVEKFNHKPVIGVELQAEPWLNDGVLGTDLAVQKQLMNQKVFQQSIEYARKVGFGDNYVWGAEWWYWMAKKQGDFGMWSMAKDLLANQ